MDVCPIHAHTNINTEAAEHVSATSETKVCIHTQSEREWGTQASLCWHFHLLWAAVERQIGGWEEKANSNSALRACSRMEVARKHSSKCTEPQLTLLESPQLTKVGIKWVKASVVVWKVSSPTEKKQAAVEKSLILKGSRSLQYPTHQKDPSIPTYPGFPISVSCLVSVITSLLLLRQGHAWKAVSCSHNCHDLANMIRLMKRWRSIRAVIRT